MTHDLTAHLEGSFDHIRERTQEVLKHEGFGILTTIDIQKTLHEKLGERMERYEILGACNPVLAGRALAADRSSGLLLPCNVVLREHEGATEVRILDPERMFELADAETRAALEPIAREARERLARALASLVAEGSEAP